jgi:hypothetical protein
VSVPLLGDFRRAPSGGAGTSSKYSTRQMGYGYKRRCRPASTLRGHDACPNAGVMSAHRIRTGSESMPLYAVSRRIPLYANSVVFDNPDAPSHEANLSRHRWAFRLRSGLIEQATVPRPVNSNDLPAGGG